MTMILFHLSFSSRTALSGEAIERAKRTGVTKWLVTLPQAWRWQARTHTARRVEGSSRCDPAGQASSRRITMAEGRRIRPCAVVLLPMSGEALPDSPSSASRGWVVSTM